MSEHLRTVTVDGEKVTTSDMGLRQIHGLLSQLEDARKLVAARDSLVASLRDEHAAEAAAMRREIADLKAQLPPKPQSTYRDGPVASTMLGSGPVGGTMR